MVDFSSMSGLSVDNPKGAYWRGADGNVWVAGDQGTNSAGAWDANTQNYWNQRGYVMQDDPARTGGGGGGSPAPTGSYGGGGSAAVSNPLNTAGIRNTQSTIDEIPALLRAALATEATRYTNTQNQFNSQETGQRKTYDDSTVTNQQNYDGNFMDSIRAGIGGLGGLMAILRGTGAAGGTAEDVARDTVGGVTSNDIRAGADTQQENQGALDSTLSTFLSELSRKRQEAQDTRENNVRAVRRDSNTQLQDLYGRMAGYYGDADRTSEYNQWMNRADKLTPSIARNSQTQLSKYDTTPVNVKAPELTAFAGASQPDVTVAPSDGQVGSGIFTMTDRRRKEAAPVPAGA